MRWCLHGVTTITRIGFTSDTHGDYAACQRVWNKFFAGVDLVVHCGDILYHGPRNPLVDGYNPAGLADFLNASPVPVLYARGNCDADVDQLMIRAPIMSPYVFLQVDGSRIMAAHGENHNREELLQLAGLYGIDIMVSGHTHRWLLEQTGNITLLNPGSPSLPKDNLTPSVAVLDGSYLRVLCINTGSVLAAVSLSQE